MKRMTLIPLLTIALLALISCSSQQQQTSTGGSGFFRPDSTVTLEGTGITLAGVTFNAPGEWTALGPSGMRKAEYVFGPIEGEADSATMAVYYFGAGQGGDPSANLDRWIGQMGQPDGSESTQKALKEKITVNGMTVHIVEVTGTYTAGGMGMGAAVEKPGYRLTGVVVEAPEGSLFFKLTGPDKTAAKMSGALATMISKIEKSAA